MNGLKYCYGRLLCRLLPALALACAACVSAYSQVTNASVTGRVTDAEGEPVIGATIMIRNESTGFTAGTATDVSGEYTVRRLPLGSPYSVGVSYIGYGGQQRTGYTLGQGDLLRVDFVLREESTSIAEVEVQANSLRKGIERLGEATSVSPKDIRTLPVNGRNFTSLIDLSPLSDGSSLAGQLATSTSYMIDGMTARGPLSGGTSNRGPYLLSMEAIREFEVVTNDYDVTLGRAGGGAVGSVTRSGTNNLSGSAFAYHRADELSSRYDARGNRRSDAYAITQYGFSLGGPIIRDRLHYFVLWEHQTDRRPMYIADIRNHEDELRYMISGETLDKFLQIARAQYGVSGAPQTGSFDKTRPSNNIFARLDWQIGATGLLTVRNNYNRDENRLGVGDNTAINLYEVYGTHVSQDNSLMASLRSVLGASLMNELKFQHLYTKDHGQPGSQLPADNIPRAIVENITSVIDGKEYRTAVQLGGQRYLPELFVNHVYQFADNLYFSAERINYTFGTDVMYTHLNSKATSEMNGRFYYNGLDAFEQNRPYRYAREVPAGDPTVKQDVLDAAVYAQMQMKLSREVELSAGVRADYTAYFSDPADNALLTSELGLKTTNRVGALQLQPRVRLTWDVGARQRDVVRIGAGIFGSNMNNYAMVNNLEFDGMRVVAFDRSAPNGGELGIVPDFAGYRADPATAPGAELFDRFGLQRVATFNINGEDTKLPTVYKANVSYNRFFSDRLRAGVTFYATLARHNYMYVDRNMADEPYFTLNNEGGRGVYVPASTISTQRGTTDWTAGRKSDKAGRVLELNSDGRINTFTAVADITWRYFRDGQFSASYTWNDSKDNTSYNGNVANSATLYRMIKDDPREMETMSYSDAQYRHKVVLFGTLPSFFGITAGVRFSGTGGTRYSAVVNGNINGDFVSGNDLAYVFDPDDPATPQNIREGLNGLLSSDETDEGFKDYLRRSFGKIAERNGGVNGFYGVWDLRVTKNFRLYRTHGIELSADVFNVANLIDKGKGLRRTLSKQSLYNVSGFDAGSRQYIYQVNNSAGRVMPGGNPWQIQLGLKYAF